VADVLAAWSAIRDARGDVYFLGESVPDAEFDAFEDRHGLSLPPDLRSVLRLARGGVELTDQGIALNGWPPPTPDDFGLPQLPEHVPPELRIVGSNLGDDAWAVWLPPRETRADATPVVVIRDYNLDDLVVFDTVLPFLALATAMGLLESGDPSAEALDALKVPETLSRSWTPERQLLDELAGWATDGREPRHWEVKAGTRLEELRQAVER
jgi:hypothetical protein